MADKWKEATLGDLIECGDAHLQTGPFGTALKATEYSTSGVPLISVGEVRHGYFEITDNTPRVSTKTTERLPKFVLKADDIVFGRKGGIDRNAIVKSQQDGWFLGSDGIRLRLSAKHSSLFFSYQMRSPTTRAWLLQHCEGTTMPSLNQDILGRVPIVLPPLPEQKRIAHILGTLDDKIELNRRMNATLEAMARAIFQSWFVDFDPVRRNAEGESLRPEDSLFPDSFEDSLIGEVPTGWEVSPMSEVIDVNPKRVLKKGNIAPYLDMKNLPTQGHSADEVIEREFSSGTKFQNGDTLLARITPCLENGKTGFVDFLEDGQVGWGSTEFITLFPKPPLPPQFGYLLARSDSLRAHAIQNMVGTSGRQRVPYECFDNYLLAVPSPEVARRFDEISAPLMAKIKANSDESRTLATLRDTLLPKLLSGELCLTEKSPKI